MGKGLLQQPGYDGKVLALIVGRDDNGVLVTPGFRFLDSHYSGETSVKVGGSIKREGEQIRMFKGVSGSWKTWEGSYKHWTEQETCIIQGAET